jgi:hypothetical protein
MHHEGNEFGPRFFVMDSYRYDFSIIAARPRVVGRSEGGGCKHKISSELKDNKLVRRGIARVPRGGRDQALQKRDELLYEVPCSVLFLKLYKRRA